MIAANCSTKRLGEIRDDKNIYRLLCDVAHVRMLRSLRYLHISISSYFGDAYDQNRQPQYPAEFDADVQGVRLGLSALIQTSPTLS
jgi:hypothetical protein